MPATRFQPVAYYHEIDIAGRRSGITNADMGVLRSCEGDADVGKRISDVAVKLKSDIAGASITNADYGRKDVEVIK
jgi:hypothetical protein